MATTDFVMPKLGLTMTEGTIARWDVAPGKTFAQGDLILVVETDKIAYDVEAPAPGVLEQVLVAAGSAVPVGTPIGRWDVGDIKVSLDAPDVAAAGPEPTGAPAVARAPPTVTPAAPPQRTEGGRSLATPYARRLARQAGIDLRGLDGTGPRGRIKAADVARAIAAEAAAPRPQATPAPVAEAPRAATFSAGIDIDTTALLALTKQINGDMPELHADLVHFVVLAVAKVAAAVSDPLVIGLAARDESGEAGGCILAAADCRMLGGVVARCRDSAGASGPAAPRGTFWIDQALHGISFLSADPPDGWAASLTIGAAREAFRADADGRPARAVLVTVVLTARTSVFDPRQGQHLLHGLRRLLEAPLLLLAS